MAGPYTWDARSASYRGARGRFVSAQQVREGLDDALDAASARMRALAVQLRERRITLREWQTAMMREVKNVHLYSAAAAKGGWNQMTPADYGRAGQRIRAQYAFLNARAAKIASGEQKLDGSLDRIAAMYGQAGRGTYHVVERREMEARGNDQERNVRGARDSCPGCLEATARGWVGIGELVPVGERDCMTSCRCRIIYQRTGNTRLTELPGVTGGGDDITDAERDRTLPLVLEDERALLGRRYEYARARDPRTGERVLFGGGYNSPPDRIEKTIGNPSAIQFTDAEKRALRGKILTHNHRSGASFSPADLRLAAEVKLHEIRAVGADYTYSARPPKGGWDADLLEVALQAFGRDWAVARAQGRSTIRTAHELWKKHLSPIGVRYRVTKTGAP